MIGFLNENDPFNTDAQVLRAKLTSITPNLARGVYGERGVLTDNDVRLYSRTLPNLRSTKAVNKGLLAMTLQTLLEGYKSILRGQAANGKDVADFSGTYKSIESQVNSLRAEIGMPPIGMSEVGVADSVLDELGL